jgi:hypothetical protein
LLRTELGEIDPISRVFHRGPAKPATCSRESPENLLLVAAGTHPVSVGNHGVYADCDSRAVLRGDLALGACFGENPSPIATKQRSLSQTQVEVGSCQTLSMLDLPRFATPPGKQRIALVSRSPKSGGDCGVSGMRVRW